MKDALLTPYFPHDSNARGNEKLVKLIKEMNWEAYGIYWALIEKLHEAGGYLEYDLKLMAFDLRFDEQKLEKIIKNFKLFVFRHSKFTSHRVRENIKVRKTKSDKAQSSARIRWGYNEKDTHANALRSQYEGNAKKKRKEKKRKEKETHTKLPVDNSKNSSLKEAQTLAEIPNFRKLLKWDDNRIKKHFLECGFSEVEIDAAMGKKF